MEDRDAQITDLISRLEVRKDKCYEKPNPYIIPPMEVNEIEAKITEPRLITKNN